MKSSLPYEMHNYAAVALPREPQPPRKPGTEPRSEKYSLRQRQKRKQHGRLDLSSHQDNQDDNDQFSISKMAQTTAGTPIAVAEPRLTGRPRGGNRRSDPANAPAKAKTKSAPLSKYRRKTANARERTRMREINTAFETLKSCVPHAITGEDPELTNEKLTKITTLRLAMKYIKILTEMLKNPSFEADFLMECHNDGDHRFTTQPEPAVPRPYEFDDTDDLELEEESPGIVAKPPAKPAAKVAVKTKSPQNSRKAPAKRPSKKTSGACRPKTTKTGPTTVSSSSALYDILSTAAPTTPPGDHASSPSYIPTAALASHQHTLSELGSFMLESDGESLHLSDRCLSPLQGSYARLLDTPPLSNLHSELTVSPLEDNPLELSLRFLDSSTDSLLYDHHYPGGCISPLATLDSMHPYSDMLHTDLAENSLALDYYLT